MTVQRVSRLYWTVRYLSARQVYYRLRRLGRRRWQRLLRRTAPMPTAPALRSPVPFWQQPTASLVQDQFLTTAQDVQQLRFTYLNHTHQFDATLGWHDPALSHLFRYHLHYFHYVLPLLAAHHAGEAGAYQTFKRIAEDWIAANQQIGGDGWHPYTVSLRVVNWLHAVNGFSAALDQDPTFKQRLCSSLYGQCQYLATDLEHDVRGNHLLENLRALIWAGLAFEGAEAQVWLRTGLYWLQQEVAEQVLPDGAHFERSPGYHVLVLQDLFEIALYLERQQQHVPDWLTTAVQKMTRYLTQILRPDGQVPMLKDTAQDAHLPPSVLLSGINAWLGASAAPTWYSALLGLTAKTDGTAQPQVPQLHLPAVGHTVLQSAQDWLIVDHGAPCPSYLPAHAQADVLTFEYFVSGAPIVTDSGIYEYTAGDWRNYFRATAAHNTIEVAGKNSTDVWSSFRAARRATPRVITFEKTATETILIVEHDGYAHLSPSVIHRRTFCWRPDQSLRIRDALLGTGSVAAVSRFHLHPSLQPQTIATGQLQLTTQLTLTSATPFTITQSWYSERFGAKVQRACITQRLTGDLPLTTEVTFTRASI